MTRTKPARAPFDALVIDADTLQIILPDGAAYQFLLPGAAAETARRLAAGEAPGEIPVLAPQLAKAAPLADAATWQESELHPFLRSDPDRSLGARNGRVVVHGEGAVAAAAYRMLAAFATDAATGTDVPVDALDAAADLLLVVVGRGATLSPGDANESALTVGCPVLFAGVLEPRRIHVGPLVVPGETACLQCYAKRRTANARNPEAVRVFLAGAAETGNLPRLPEPLLETAGTFAGLEAARFMAGNASATLGAVLSIGVDRYDTVVDPVLRVPRCAACSRLRRNPPTEPWLQASKEDGTPS